MNDFPNLPKSWQLKTLAQVCTSTSSNITFKNIQDKKGDYPIYGASGVVSYVDFYTKENQSLGIVKDGAGIGRVFLLPPKASVIGTLHYVESNDDLNLKYLFYFLQSINLARYITGSAIPHIYFRDWKKEQIPIPPLEIQRRIVKRLDEVFSRIENGTKHLKSAKDNLIKYKQSLLKSAFNGTLTNDLPLSQGESTAESSLRENPQGFSWQSAHSLSQGESTTKQSINTHPLAPSAREGEREDSPRARAGEQESCRALKSPLPCGGDLGVGSTCTHNNVVDCHESANADSRNDENSPSFAGGQSSSTYFARDGGDSEYSPSLADCTFLVPPPSAEGVRGWVNPRNDDKDSLNGESANLPQGWTFKTLGEVCDILDNMRKPINATEREQRLKNSTHKYAYYGATGQVGYIDDFLCDFESILLGEDGAPFLEPFKDKAYIVSGKYWVNNHAHILTAKQNFAINKFICYFLNIVDYMPYVSGTTRLKLNQSAMKQIKIPIPPLETQKQIVAILERHFTSADKVSAYIDSCLSKAKQLKSSLLKSAFAGELT